MNEQREREDSKESFERETKRKKPKRETEIKMGTTGKEKYIEGRKDMGTN
jgi:hypothetical protein